MRSGPVVAVPVVHPVIPRVGLRFESLAEREDFIVVHPTGAFSPNLPVLNMGLGWELVDALDTPGRDDIEFARALIDDLVDNW